MNENAWQIVLSFCKSLWPFKFYMSVTHLLISWFKVQQSSCRWLDTLMRKCLQIRDLYCFWANKIWHYLSCVIFLEYLCWNALRWLMRLKINMKIHLHKFFRRCILWKTLNVDLCLAQGICDNMYWSFSLFWLWLHLKCCNILSIQIIYIPQFTQ